MDTGRITDVNPFLVKLLGFSHGEMVGQTVGELSPFKDIVSNQAMLERLQKDGYVRYEDLPLETKDGRKMAVEFVSNVYQAGDKKVIQCNIRDITERKRTEEMLHKQAKLLDLAHDAIFVADQNDRITYWNLGAQQRYGWSREEALGKQTHSFLQTVFPQPLEEIKAIMLQDGHWEGELHEHHSGWQPNYRR